MADTADDRAVLRAAQSLARRTAPLQRRTNADVARQRTEALLHNLSSAEEFLTPSASRDSGGSGGGGAPPPQLLPHQKDGVRWLLAMHANGRRSGVVADEMGLGKTVQVTAFFTALAQRGCFGTYLVVAPLTTLGNWARELQKWGPWLSLTLYSGDAAARVRLRARLRRRHRGAFQKADHVRELWTGEKGQSPEGRVAGVAALVGGVVLASYDMVLADKGALARLLPWDVVVVDEAQRLKRMGGRLLQQLRKADGAMRVVLTGTPVQNNARELWTLMEFVAPECFEEDAQREGGKAAGSVHAALDAWVLAQAKSRALRQQQQLRNEVSKPGVSAKKRAREDSAGDEEEDDTSDVPDDPVMAEVVAELHRALRPLMLRRTKATAGIALPPKVQVILHTPLTSLQRQLYRAVTTEDTFLNNRLMHQRRCCLYPGYLMEHLAHAATPAKTTRTLTKKIAKVVAGADPYTVLSSKLHLLARMLPALHVHKHRVLLFSQFTSVLDALEEFLAARLPQLTYRRLDGATTAADRQVSTADFQATPVKEAAAVVATVAGNVENGLCDDDLVFLTPPSCAARHAAEDGAMLRPRPINALPVDKATTPVAKHLFGNATPLRTTLRGETRTEHNELPQDEEKSFLFLISTRTGGAGLNLTGADTVILFDGDFNPHNDHQAIDRCHRIGQRRPVAVYRLLCPGTVEADQLAVAQRKLLLERAVLSDEQHLVTGARGENDRMTARPEDGGTVFVAVPLADATSVRLAPLDTTDGGCASVATAGSGALSAAQLDLLLDRSWLVGAAAAEEQGA